MNADTIAIIIAILGVGLALWRAIATIRQEVDSRHKDLRQNLGQIRQDIKESNARIDSLRHEMRTDIATLHARIDALYQALFNHKDSAT